MKRLLLIFILSLMSLIFCYRDFNVTVINFRKGECRAWFEYMKTYNKVYSSLREQRRRRIIFTENLRKIQFHNEFYALQLETFNCTINQYADLTIEEFQKNFGFKIISTPSKGFKAISLSSQLSAMSLRTFTAAAKIDWRRTAVTSVKRQGICGSCYCFSAAGALEAQIYLKTQKLVSVSSQNFVDCVRTRNSLGCGGGLMTDIYEYTMKNGIIDDSLYTYQEMESIAGCKSKNLQKLGVKVTGYVELTNLSEDELQKAVSNIGPVSVAIDGSWQSMQFYEYGVYFEPQCNASNVNHAVLVVGYGTDTTYNPPLDYWIVKNSWGSGWGEHGYLRIARNKSNHCGIASKPSYPIVTNKIV